MITDSVCTTKDKTKEEYFSSSSFIFLFYILKNKKQKTTNIWQEEGGKVKDNQVIRMDKK